MLLQCGKFQLDLALPVVMGIVNVTPDSFSDGGQHLTSHAALQHAHNLIKQGADILDLGGESTRPGALTISVQEELDRVMPVIEGLQGAPIPLSIDTCKPEVMNAALKAGVSMVNDTTALQHTESLACAIKHQITVCLMHSQGTPQTMQQAPHYDDVVTEVKQFLQDRVSSVSAAGISLQRIVIDPGFGFGKTFEHNLALLRHLANLTDLGVPVLVGLSRKSMLGKITGQDINHRIHASVAAALLAVQRGANIVRVHDVQATKDALKVWKAVAA